MPGSSYVRRRMRGFVPEAVEHLRRRYEESDETIASIAADFGVHGKTITTLAHKEGWLLRKNRPPRGMPESIRLNLMADQAIGDGGLAMSADAAREAPSSGRRSDVGQGAMSDVATAGTAAATPGTAAPSARTAPHVGPPAAPGRPANDPAAGVPASIAAAQAAGTPSAAASAGIAARLEQALEKELRKVESLRNEFGAVAHRSIEGERTARTLATLSETLFKVRRLRAPVANGADADDDMPADVEQFRRALAERIEVFVRGRADGGVSADAADAGAGAPAP